jgi:hypothetical protein
MAAVGVGVCMYHPISENKEYIYRSIIFLFN